MHVDYTLILFLSSQLCSCIYWRFETAGTLWCACVEVLPASEHDIIICETRVHDTLMSVVAVGRPEICEITSKSPLER